MPAAKSPSQAPSLDALIDRYSPAIAAQARAVLAELRKTTPGAIELVYDTYNALAIGFCATERPSDVIFSIALYPRWINLFLMHAVNFPDPHELLKGEGKGVRHIVLERGVETLREPPVAALLRHALKVAIKPLDPSATRRVVVKSINAKQRPRRPAPAKRPRKASRR